MSERDVELMRAGLADLADEGYESVLDRVHPEFEMTTRPEFAAEPQVYRGVEGMRRWWESFFEVMDQVRVEPSVFHDAGDGLVVVDFVLRATGQSSGVDVAQHAYMLIRIRDELMYRIDFYLTLDDALAAAR